MNIKEYLNIKEDVFTLSNQFLFIYHNNKNEFILNLLTNQKYVNPIIPNPKSEPLSQFFNITIHKNHKLILYHNNKIAYHEIFIPTLITHDIDELGGQLIYSIQINDSTYIYTYHYQSEFILQYDQNMKPINKPYEAF